MPQHHYLEDASERSPRFTPSIHATIDPHPISLIEPDPPIKEEVPETVPETVTEAVCGTKRCRVDADVRDYSIPYYPPPPPSMDPLATLVAAFALGAITGGILVFAFSKPVVEA